MKTARIYAFGDSLTYGAWDTEGGWCDRVKRILHLQTTSDNSDVKYQMLNLGIGGEDSSSLVMRFESELKTRVRGEWPTVIIIGTGANDTRYTESTPPAISAEEYRQNLESLISVAKKYTQKILFVGVAVVENEIQNFKSTLLSNELLRKHYQVMSDVAKSHNIPVVDVNTGLASSKNPVYYKDGVHVNDVGHEIISQLVLSELQKIL